MFQLHSMLQVSLYTVIAALILVAAALRRNPASAAGSFIGELTRSGKLAIHLAAMLAVLFFNKIEIMAETHMKLPSDFTPKLAAWEPPVVESIQRVFEHPLLTYVLTYAYVIIFPAVMIASLLIYTCRSESRLTYAVCYALMLNYMLAIPFYLFFPVNEVHAFEPDVRFLIPDVFPTFESTYRSLSALNNCFPSLHTSISVAMAVVASRSRDRFWRFFTRASAAVIIFSIFYLGIHWLTDMAAGLALGVFAGRTALRLSEGRALYRAAAVPYEVDPDAKRRFGKWQRMS